MSLFVRPVGALPLVALALALLLAAHGGQNPPPAVPGPMAPGSGKPPGPARPRGPGGLGALGPTAAGNLPGAVATLPSSGPTTADLTLWNTWWRLNEAPYLALKEHVHSAGPETGSDGWFLGDGQRPQHATLRPREEQVRLIAPALYAVLARESDNDLVTGALIALAKLGDAARTAELKPEETMLRFLDDPAQEVRETAALSLGILASPRSIPTLAHLVWDTPAGRKAVGAKEVDYRTRAFATYGLALVGARTESELERQMIVSIVRRALEEDDTRTSDLQVACVIALGLVPLATIESPGAGEEGRPRPERSRLAELRYLSDFLADDDQENLPRAHCPVALARLLEGLPEPHRSVWRVRIADDLIERIERERDEPEVVQSCVLALGALGTNDGEDPLDARIRRTLANVPRMVSEPQARAFALTAAAEAGARPGRTLPGRGIDDARGFLIDQMLGGKNAMQPWAALATGVLCRRLESDGTLPALDPARRALEFGLADERSPERIGAYALGAGLARSVDCAPRLMKLLEKELQEDARGQVAIGLALLDHQEAVGLLRKIVAGAKYRPELLRQCSIALGILGDKTIAPELAGMLRDARSLASQAAIASALGFIGDRRSVDPLLLLLQSQVATAKARAFAAVALGNVADKEMLPWNSKIALGLNYRAAPATLSDPVSGTGVLDIF